MCILCYYRSQEHTKRISLNLSKQDIEEISQMEIAAMKEHSRLRMSEYQKELEIESENSQSTIVNINLQTLSSCNSLSQTASLESML